MSSDHLPALATSLVLAWGCHEVESACDQPLYGKRCIVSDRGLEWKVHDTRAMVAVNRDDRTAAVVVGSARSSGDSTLRIVASCESAGFQYFVRLAAEGAGDAALTSQMVDHRHVLYSAFDLSVSEDGVPGGTLQAVKKVRHEWVERGGDDGYFDVSSFTSTDGTGTIIEATNFLATVELDFAEARSRLILPVCSYSPSEEGWTE